MSIDGNVAVRRVAVLGGELVERSMALALDRAERLVALGMAVALRGARSEFALRSAQTAIGVMHWTSPRAARVAGRLTGVSLLAGGQGVRAGMLVLAATIKRLRQ